MNSSFWISIICWFISDCLGRLLIICIWWSSRRINYALLTTNIGNSCTFISVFNFILFLLISIYWWFLINYFFRGNCFHWLIFFHHSGCLPWLRFYFLGYFNFWIFYNYWFLLRSLISSWFTLSWRIRLYWNRLIRFTEFWLRSWLPYLIICICTFNTNECIIIFLSWNFSPSLNIFWGFSFISLRVFFNFRLIWTNICVILTVSSLSILIIRSFRNICLRWDHIISSSTYSSWYLRRLCFNILIWRCWLDVFLTIITLSNKRLVWSIHFFFCTFCFFSTYFVSKS